MTRTPALLITPKEYAHPPVRLPPLPAPTGVVLARVWALCLGAPKVVPLSRSQCHRLTLDLKGISRRMAASSIGLQLGHITGLSSPGYAWRLDGVRAEIWYWEEKAQAAPQGEQAPTLACPEVLLRPPLPDGLHLLRCQQGFEALRLVQGHAYRSRWFAQLPSPGAWQHFVQDAGVDPARHALPEAQTLALHEAPQRGWSIHSSLVRPVGGKTWAALAALALGGAVFFAFLGYSLKLSYQVQTVRHEYSALALQSAESLKLQQELDAQRKPLAAIANFQPKTLQFRLMARLAEAGFFNETTKVSLQEWEYRNNRIRIQFSVPAEGFALSQFLESIEKLGLFKDVRLLSGTPPLSVAIQAALADPGGGAP